MSTLLAFNAFFSSSKQLLNVLSIACNVSEDSYDKFIRDLAEDGCGFNMVYMLHKDSLRTGTSYQNEAHLSLKQHLNVSNHYSIITTLIIFVNKHVILF